MDNDQNNFDKNDEISDDLIDDLDKFYGENEV